ERIRLASGPQHRQPIRAAGKQPPTMGSERGMVRREVVVHGRERGDIDAAGAAVGHGDLLSISGVHPVARRVTPRTTSDNRLGPCQPRSGAAYLAFPHEGGYSRQDLAAPTSAVEDPVVTDALLQIVPTTLRRNCRAQIVRGSRLP